MSSQKSQKDRKTDQNLLSNRIEYSSERNTNEKYEIDKINIEIKSRNDTKDIVLPPLSKQRNSIQQRTSVIP